MYLGPEIAALSRDDRPAIPVKQALVCLPPEEGDGRSVHHPTGDPLSRNYFVRRFRL